MQISKLLSTLMKDLAQQAKKGSAASKQQSTGSNLGKAATFQNSLKGSVPQHMVYGRSGQLMRLGTLQGQLNMRESMFAALLAQKWNKTMSQFQTGSGPEAQAQALNVRQWDGLAATLLQQSFDLLQELFQKEKEKQHKKFKRQSDSEEDTEQESEEQALDLLETLLQYADDADDKDAFCEWAASSIQQSRQELERRMGTNKLPESTERMFSIMEDAVEALQHGAEPSFIFSRLKEEIGSH
jgi:hypothetical protein